MIFFHVLSGVVLASFLFFVYLMFRGLLSFQAVMSLVAEERIRKLFITWSHSEREGIDSMSGASMSPDLGDMWRQGYPVSPQWEGGLELDSGDDYGNDNEKNDSFEASDTADEGDPKEYISEVSESSLWASIRDCLTPSDILVLRTAGS